MKQKEQPEPSRKFLLIVFIVVTVALLVGSYAYYRYETDRIRQEKYQEIATIAGLKSDQIVQWRKERLNDALRSAKAPFFGKALLEWLAGNRDTEREAELSGRLRVEREVKGYADIVIVDRAGGILLSATPQSEPLNSDETQALEEAFSKKSPIMTDLYRSSYGLVQLSAIAPFLDQKGQPVAAVVLRTNAERILYPLISSWPSPSKTSETLLVRKDGNDVLFLNELRHTPNTALVLRQALSRTDLPASQAISGKEGLFFGNDYRGVEVLADLRAIPDSQWFMVAKVDTSEILAEARYRGTVIVLFATVLILLAGGAIGYAFRYRQASLYRDLYRSERQQRAAQELFRTTLYSIGDGVITTNTRGLVEQVNRVAEQLTGWMEAEARGKSLDEVFRIVNEESREVTENPVQRVLREGKVVGLANHTLLISKDGSERPIADSGAPITDEDGIIIGVVLVFRDQTEERAAQKALQESGERYRTVADFTHDWEYWVNSEGKFPYVSPSCERMTGYSAEEFLSDPDLMKRIIHPDDYPEVSEHFRIARNVDFESPHSLDFRIIHRDGQTRWIGHVCQSVWSTEGLPLGRRASNRDITFRKRSELAQRRLSTAVEQASDAIVITDGQGNIEYVNPAFERITGYTYDEVVSERRNFFKSGEYDSAAMQSLLDILLSGQSWSGRLVSQRKDGSRYDDDVTITPVRDASGDIINFVAIKRDVSREIELQRQLLQAQKMEAIGTLAGGVAHDFNNLLQVILGYSELLLSDKRDTDPNYGGLKKISHAGQRGADLVQDLLMFSRKVKPKLGVCNLNQEIVQIESLLSRTIPKMIRIRLELAGDLQSIEGDPSQIGQALMNLALNACDAMPDGGALTIETRNVELEEDYCATHLEVKPGRYVLLCVSDTGHGINEETLSHIFEPFFTTKEAGKGTGLGLSTVYGIVKQHGGYIYCYSEPGHGTSFKIYLPAIQEETESESPITETIIRGGTETILLVDDEEMLRDLGTTFLTRWGYRVLTATDGQEALEIYRQGGEGISLVILDLIMPEMDGKRCLAELLKIDSGARVLIASGYSENGPLPKAELVGAIGYVEKPYEMRRLLQMVRDILDETG